MLRLYRDPGRSELLGLSNCRQKRYNRHDPMMMGLALHRSSKVANRINWCLMLSNGNMGDQGHYDASSRAVRDLILDPNYQLVSKTQSRYYIFTIQNRILRGFSTDPLQV